jgi:hypothetical protein
MAVHSATEKDLAGKWSGEEQIPNYEGKPWTTRITLQLNADGTFQMTRRTREAPQQVKDKYDTTLTGKWSLKYRTSLEGGSWREAKVAGKQILSLETRGASETDYLYLLKRRNGKIFLDLHPAIVTNGTPPFNKGFAERATTYMKID